MAQSYNGIAGTDAISGSRTDITGRDDAIKSCFSGTAFPTTDTVVGMFCYRTDQEKLYELRSTGPDTWVEIANLASPPLSKAGGTLTGFLTLHADPTSLLHAATKQYVDAQDAGRVATTRQITAGTGLSGGGSLASDRTLALAAAGVTPGTYGNSTTGAVPILTVDTYGRVTSASSYLLSSKVPFTSSWESSEIGLLSGSNQYSGAHGLGGMPKLFAAVLRCKTTDKSYAVGSEIALPASGVQSFGGGSQAHMTVGATSTEVIVNQSVNIIIASNDASPTAVGITVANWRLVLRAWR